MTDPIQLVQHKPGWIGAGPNKILIKSCGSEMWQELLHSAHLSFTLLFPPSLDISHQSVLCQVITIQSKVKLSHYPFYNLANEWLSNADEYVLIESSRCATGGKRPHVVLCKVLFFFCKCNLILHDLVTYTHILCFLANPKYKYYVLFWHCDYLFTFYYPPIACSESLFSCTIL